MKNKKLLMPLAGVAALGAITPIVMTATSCGEKADSTISKIEATTTKTDTYVGVTLKRSDIKVTVTYKDATKAPKVVTDWTCDAIGTNGYHFGKAETKTFTIKYHGHKSNITCTASMAGAMAFDDLLPANLAVGTGYGTETAVHVYAVNVEKTEPHEVEAEYLNIVPTDTSIVEYNATKHTLVAKKEGTTTVKANVIGITEAAYTTTTTVTVTGNTLISKAEADGEGGAIVTIKAGDTNTKICNVPEYVKIGSEDLPVTTITADTGLTNAETLALPATITSITNSFAGDGADDNHVFSIMYDGTESDWNAISCESGWAGYGVTGAWCFGDDETTYVNFARNHDATYDVEEHTFTSTMGSILAKSSHTVGFDLSLAYKETTLPAFDTINITNSGLAIGYLEVDGVYINGVALTKIDTGAPSAGEYIATGGRHNTKVTFAPSTALTLADRIVITFRSPLINASVVNASLYKAE